MGADLPEEHVIRTPAQKLYLLLCVVLSTAYCLVGGSLYSFPLFSNALQDYGYAHIALLGGLGNCGMFVMGFFAGISIDRFGQKAVCAAGVALIGIGWLMLRGCILNGWSESGVGFSLLVIGTGGVSSLMAMLTWQQSQFSVANRGKITALLLAAYCLSGAMWAPIYEANYSLDQQLPDYCAMVATVAFVLGAVIVSVTGQWKLGGAAAAPPQSAPSAAPAAASAASHGATAPASDALPWEKRGVGADSVGLPSDSFGVELPVAGSGSGNGALETDSSSSAGAGGAHGASVAKAPATAAHPPDEGKPPTVGTVLFCLSRYSVFFWLLYAPVFVVLGACFVLVNNTSLIVDSLRGVHDVGGANASSPAATAAAATLVQNVTVVFGVCNALFRVGGGWITDIVAAKGYSRLWILLVSSVIAVIACLVLSSATTSSLMFGNVLMGMADGLCFAVWPVATRDVFGKARYGKFYGLLNTAVGFGSMGFNAMASTMYHNVGYTLLGSDGLSRFVCDGSVCFQQTFVTSAVLCAFFAVLPTAVLLYWMNREEKRKAETLGYVRGEAPKTMAEAIYAANLMSSQVEIDTDMLRDEDPISVGAMVDSVRGGAAATLQGLRNLTGGTHAPAVGVHRTTSIKEAAPDTPGVQAPPASAASSAVSESGVPRRRLYSGNNDAEVEAA